MADRNMYNVCAERVDEADEETMASANASNTETVTGNVSSQHGILRLDTDRQMVKETPARDAGNEFVSTEAKRPGSAKLWSHSVGGIAAHSIKFFCGNPSVEKTEGIIHLYREE